jgi:hypothetical protein
MTLDDAVSEVLGLLTGLDLTYAPEQDRYRAITRALNRSMRSMALEKEWSYYSTVETVGNAGEGEQQVSLRNSVRPRIINDDAVRLVDENGRILRWAYFLPRDALHKYAYHRGLWASVVRNTLTFSRPFTSDENGLEVQIPVMREPVMFRLPSQPEDPNEALVTVPTEIREQEIDFPYPDVVILRAAFYYAQTDPVMQPRVQTLEAQYKDLMYQVIERDDRNTDTPYINGFSLGIQNGLGPTFHAVPSSDARP